MDQNPIATQPLRASVSPEILAEVPTAPTEVLFNDNVKKETENGDLKEHLSKVTAVFHPDAELSEEEKQKRRQQREEFSDCCCVYSNDDDAFCLYILCHWICDCFRGIGHCTEDCFEGCANCLSECCEGDGCIESCCSCDCGDGGDVTSAADADGLGGCLDCCTSCDCDCSS